MPMSRLHHRAKQSLSGPDGGALNRGEISRTNVAVCFIEIEALVVCEFAFQHDMAVNTVCESSSQPDVVGRSLRDAKPIEKYSSFHS